MIHTMRPAKKPTKKKKKKEKGGNTSPRKPLDPALQEKTRKFPGLAMPDNPARAQTLLEEIGLKKEKDKEKKEAEVSSKDAKVADMAMNEVRESECVLMIAGSVFYSIQLLFPEPLMCFFFLDEL